MTEKAKKDNSNKLTRTAANKARMQKKFPRTFQGIPDFPKVQAPAPSPRATFSQATREDFTKVFGIFPVFQVVSQGVVLESTLHQPQALDAFKATHSPCELRRLTPRGFSVLDQKTF